MSNRIRILRGGKKQRTAGEAHVLFSMLPLHAMFFLQPPQYVNIAWIKSHKNGAQVLDSSNDSQWADQYFPDDYPVYINVR